MPQLDIMPRRSTGNRPIAPTGVGDSPRPLGGCCGAQAGQIKQSSAWLKGSPRRQQQNTKAWRRIGAKPYRPRVLRRPRRDQDRARDRQRSCCPRGANTLDLARKRIDSACPASGLDSGTGGDGHRAGVRDRRCGVRGKPVVAIEGDSAFGSAGWENETICRYQLKVVTVFNTAAIYRGDAIKPRRRVDRRRPPDEGSPLRKDDRGLWRRRVSGVDPPGLTKALTAALASGKPTLIDARSIRLSDGERPHRQTSSSKQTREM